MSRIGLTQSIKSGLAKSICLMAWLNLRRNLRRNLATGIAITAGFAAFMLAAGFANRVENVLSRHTIFGLRAGHITILRKNALEMYPVKPRNWSLTPEDQTRIKAVLDRHSEIEMYGPLLTGQGIIGNGCKTLPFLVNGIDVKADKFAMTKNWDPPVGVFPK
ncbi:MAG: hypothetical protein NTV34_14230 [Proteobacteria bacterium]|nr:hypothetical protein [Pseudomonadota bacterium]